MQAAMQWVREGEAGGHSKESKQRTSWRKRIAGNHSTSGGNIKAERMGGVEVAGRSALQELLFPSPHSLALPSPHTQPKTKHTPWLLMRAVVAAAALSPHSLAFTFLAQYNKIDSKHASLSTSSTLAAPILFRHLLSVAAATAAAFATTSCCCCRCCCCYLLLLVSFNSMALIHSFNVLQLAHGAAIEGSLAACF